MKKALSIILTAALAWAGLWLALIADVNDHETLGQGGLALLAAVCFCGAILAAGWGNSLNWKGGCRNE